MSKDRRKILVTGAQGFLGTHLLKALRDGGLIPFQYEGDVRLIHTLRAHFPAVCHLAGFTKTSPCVSERLLFDSNVTGTASVMLYCARENARCVFASSAAVYEPKPILRRIKEEDALAPVSAYGISKLLAENICAQFAQSAGVATVALRIFNLYGPGQKMPFLVPSLLDALSRNKPADLATPAAMRDFVHVQDVCAAFVAACGIKTSGFLALNVGTSQGHSVEEVARLAAQILKVKPRLRRDPRRRKERDFVIAETRAIRRTLGWKPSVLLRAGLEQTAQTVS